MELTEEQKCVAGCIDYWGGERRHHKDCPHYPESISKRMDDLQSEVGKIQWNKYPEVKPPKGGQYFVLVKNKNKANGIYLPDVADYDHNGEWQQSTTWEDVVRWAHINLPNQ